MTANRAPKKGFRKRMCFTGGLLFVSWIGRFQSLPPGWEGLSFLPGYSDLAQAPFRLRLQHRQHVGHLLQFTLHLVLHEHIPWAPFHPDYENRVAVQLSPHFHPFVRDLPLQRRENAARPGGGSSKFLLDPLQHQFPQQQLPDPCGCSHLHLHPHMPTDSK
jgi:hypothetical protein